MRVELVGFSQGVSLSNRETPVSYLDFKREDGHAFRLPISSEALELLLSEVYGASENAPPARTNGVHVEGFPEPEEERLGTSFGGEPEEEEEPEPETAPASEEEVPSL